MDYNNFQNSESERGFSLVQLLFIILAIGILILVATVFLNDARAKARDAKRIVDIRRIQTALEFFSLEYGYYPTYDSVISLGREPHIKLCDDKSGAFVSATTQCGTDFMAPVPSDPQSDKQYLYISNREGYTISFVTEKDTSFGSPGNYYAHSEGIDSDPTVK